MNFAPRIGLLLIHCSGIIGRIVMCLHTIFNLIQLDPIMISLSSQSGYMWKVFNEYAYSRTIDIFELKNAFLLFMAMNEDELHHMNRLTVDSLFWVSDYS
ncbi:hypothetical protein ACOSQ3_009301 [Xanthoceras sorbifolium]